MADIDWTFHDDTQRYTATLDAYRLSLWQNEAGWWSATVLLGMHGSARHNLKTQEEARAWCTAEVARRVHNPR